MLGIPCFVDVPAFQMDNVMIVILELTSLLVSFALKCFQVFLTFGTSGITRADAI